MSLAHGILGFLSYGSMSGYDLIKAFDASVRFFWYAQSSHIYLELNKLEERGFVESERVMQSDRPNKKVYSITGAGKEEFLRWLAGGGDEQKKGMKNAFLMKIFFSGWCGPDQSIARLRAFIKDCEEYLKEMGGIPESIASYGRDLDPYKSLYWQFTADFGYSLMRMYIDWAKRCIEKLEDVK